MNANFLQQLLELRTIIEIFYELKEEFFLLVSKWQLHLIQFLSLYIDRKVLLARDWNRVVLRCCLLVTSSQSNFRTLSGHYIGITTCRSSIFMDYYHTPHLRIKQTIHEMKKIYITEYSVKMGIQYYMYLQTSERLNSELYALQLGVYLR